MATSGTYDFGLTNASIIFEAFDRIGVRPTQMDRHMLNSARVSMNLELLDWSNRGFNFWQTTSGTIPLVANQATYTLPANMVTLTELYYTQVNGGGTGVNQDRTMTAITRQQYSQIVNKLQTGIPTQYWFQMLVTPQLTIWEVPYAGATAPNFVLSYYGLMQIQDANTTANETPNIHYRATDALIAGLALRLCEKFGPVPRLAEKKAAADIAWENMVRRDQEPGPITVRPEIGRYGRMGM